MIFYIIIGLGFWIITGLIAIIFILDANEKHHARYVAPYLPVSKWRLMSLAQFRLAAAGAIDEVSSADVKDYLAKHERGMTIETVWDFEKFYFLPLLDN
jgi:hypothetical protein